MQELYSLFEKAKPILPNEITIADLGSASGDLGELFKKKLSKNHKVKLYIIEIIKELLDKNKNKDTIKIYEDLRNFKENEIFDLAIMRSILHYFPKDEQLNVLKNVCNSLKNEGYLIIQTFIQKQSDLELFNKLNHYVKRNLQLLNKEDLIELFKKSGFSNIKNIGKISTWNLSSKDFQARYELTNEQINHLRSVVEKTNQENRKGFTLTKDRFTIPVPYQVFLLRK